MSAATLTLALSDFRRLAKTLIAAEVARRAVLIREAEKIADEIAQEQQLTRDMIAAFQQAAAAELSDVHAETATLAEGSKCPPPAAPDDVDRQWAHHCAQQAPPAPITAVPSAFPMPAADVDLAEQTAPDEDRSIAEEVQHYRDLAGSPPVPEGPREAAVGTRRLTDSTSDGWTSDEDDSVGPLLGVPAANGTAQEVPAATGEANGKPRKGRRNRT